MRFDDIFLAVILYSIIFGPFVLFAGSSYFAFKKRDTFWIIAVIISGLWSCWWLYGFYASHKEGWCGSGCPSQEAKEQRSRVIQQTSVQQGGNTTESGSTAISGAVFVELQDMGSPLARYYVGTKIDEGTATVNFRSGAEAYLNAPDTNTNPVKNDLLKMQGISLVRWEVDGRAFAKFTK